MVKPGIVSVMMPAYNAEQYIGEAIESVLAQSYTRWELIIINDGSTDRTADAAAQFNDSRIRVIHQANRGEAAARNTALKYVHGQFVAFLDADDVYLPNHLEVTAGYLLAHPDRDGVYTDGYYCDRNGKRLQTLSSRRRGPFEGRVFEEVVRASVVFGPPVCVVLRHNIIALYDLRFDENIVIGPDWDFFAQYSDKASFGYVDQSTCLYRVHESNITSRTDLSKRASSLAECRLKAIKMEKFGTCSVETRFAVFYDLLVNQLRGFAEKQSEITQWAEFKDLPSEHQARLMRLMASRSLISGGEQAYIKQWIRRSRELNPRDGRGALLAGIYRVSPLLCKLLLHVRTFGQPDPLGIPPFADLKGVNSS